MNVSPFNFADKIKKPLLLIHGEADNNPGTFTVQSERLYQAIKGNGGTARLVFCPMKAMRTGRSKAFSTFWPRCLTGQGSMAKGRLRSLE